MDNQETNQPSLAQVLGEAIPSAVAAREEQDAKARRDQVRDFLIELQTGSYDKAATYVALLTSGGYVGAFAIWSYVQPYLARWEVLSIALLLGFSLTVFVGWTIYAMTIVGRQQMQIVQVITAPDADFEAAVANHQKLETAERNRVVKLWPWVFGISVLPGIGGGLLLLVACARHLISGI